MDVAVVWHRKQTAVESSLLSRYCRAVQLHCTTVTTCILEFGKLEQFWGCMVQPVCSEHAKRYLSTYNDNSMQSVISVFLFIKRRVQEIIPSLSGSTCLQIWRSIRKSLSKFLALFKLKLLFSALLVIYLKWYHLLNYCGWKWSLKSCW